MPCFRCGDRQTDPVAGPSTWQRAVLADEQVLVCPSCQQDPEVAGALRRCPACGSPRLAKSLGVVSCRACGRPAEEEAERGSCGHDTQEPYRKGPRTTVPADEIGSAIDRVLRRV